MAADEAATTTDTKTEQRMTIEKGLAKYVDNIIRELVKVKLMARPKGSKEEKAQLVVGSCLAADSDAFLDKTCEVMEKYQLAELIEQLRLLARPPPVEDTNPDEEVEEEQEEPQADEPEPEEETPEEPVDVGPKPKSYTEVLQESSGTFIDCLVLNNDLLDHLQNNSVINLDMRSKIVCCSCRSGKTRVLLKFMMELGPRSLEQFIGALRATRQDFLANILAASPFI